VRIGIEHVSNIRGKTFIRLSSGTRKSAKICSPPLSLIDPKVRLYSRECTLSIILSEVCGDLDRRYASIGKEFDDVTLFSFHDFDTFCPIDPLLPAKFAL
jgi:hypothetical protein